MSAPRACTRCGRLIRSPWVIGGTCRNVEACKRRAVPKTDAPVFGTVEFFIERNRAKIAAVVRRRLGRQYDHKRHGTDQELRLWVLNDEELYTWAVREGMQP